MHYDPNRDAYVTTIGGKEIVLGKQNMDNDLKAYLGSLGISNVTINDESSRSFVENSIMHMKNTALLNFGDFLQDNNIDSTRLTSLWRPDGVYAVNDPHSSGYAFDIASVTKDGQTVYLKNTSTIYQGHTTFNDQYNANADLLNEIYNSLYSNPRVAQFLNPSRIYSTIPGNTYNQLNISKQPRPSNMDPSLYNLMSQHDTHGHLMFYGY